MEPIWRDVRTLPAKAWKGQLQARSRAQGQFHSQDKIFQNMLLACGGGDERTKATLMGRKDGSLLQSSL